MDHEDSLLPEFADKLVDVDGLLGLDSLQHVVQGDERARTSHACAAVNQHEVLLAVGVGLAHPSDEVDHGDGIGWNTVVGPTKIVVQTHLHCPSIRLISLNIR